MTQTRRSAPNRLMIKRVSGYVCGIIMPAQVHIPIRSSLSNYVTAIWETTPPGVSREIILPRGLVEIVFNLADPMHGILPHKENAGQTPVCFLQGWNTHVVDVHYTGRQHLFGIRLQPYMVKPLLGIPASECKNTLIDLSLVQPRFKSLWMQLNEATSFAARVAIIEKDFPSLTENACARTKYFCDLFSTEHAADLQSVDAVSKEVCYSSRQLNRKAQAIFGFSAEELITHKRFRTAVQLMHGPEQSLTSIAYHAGFYDQAHFCRLFKNFTGLTATQYQAQKSELPFHIFS